MRKKKGITLYGLAQKKIEKVESAAEELDYVPNCWARLLARQSSGCAIN